MKKTLNLFIVLVLMSVFNCSKDNNDPTPNNPTTGTVKIIATNNLAVEPDTDGLFTVSLSTVLDTPLQVNFTVSGTATNGEDYQTIGSNVTIAANTQEKTIPVLILSDNENEDTESVIITLTSTNNSNISLGIQKTATLTIQDEPVEFTAENASSFMVNPNSTPETIALFYNLKTLPNTGFAIGQQDAFNSFYNNDVGDSDIKKATGFDPALLGSDFMFITDDNNNGQASNWFFQQEQIIKNDAIEAYNKGMINTFCWHFREPYSGDEFYANNIDPTDLANAFSSILPGGENHDYYKQKLDKIAEVANSLVGSDGKKVPIIFRPFHEFDGSWFWWGESYCSAGQFKTLWQFTVEYLRDTKGVNNILYAYSPDNSYTNSTDYLNRYPGDAYVDILGMDNYGDFNNQGQTGSETANSKLQMLSNLAIEKTKIAALTETGYFVTPGTNNPISGFYSNYLYDALTDNNVKISYMMFWYNTENTYCTPVPGTSALNDFVNFTDLPKSLLENELPNIYQLP